MDQPKNIDTNKTRKNSREFYNIFYLFYPFVDIFLRPQKRLLFQELNKLPKGNVLEIGIGNGRHIRHYGKHRVTGIDTSDKMVHYARRFESENVDIIEMDGQNLLFQDQSYDYIVLSYVVSVVENPEKLLAESHRVLKKGGKLFILNHFTPNNALKYLDLLFQKISHIFYFQSFFDINDIRTIQLFRLLDNRPIGPLSYFKLLIYQK